MFNILSSWKKSGNSQKMKSVSAEFNAVRKVDQMKRAVLFAAVALCAFNLFAEDTVVDIEQEEPAYVYTNREKVWPDAKSPRGATAEQTEALSALSVEKTSETYMEETRDTFSFGMTEQICNLLDSLASDKDVRFAEEAYELFQATKSPIVREKILSYFSILEDPCLEDFAVEVLNDPYDVRKNTVIACFNYVGAVKSSAALPALVDLMEKPDLGYFNNALDAIGKIGGDEEALYLATYLSSDDLDTAQRQSLMRVLGKLKAVATWDILSEICQDQNENMYVRAYAAEAIGAMEKPESRDILIDLYEADEPQIREYVIRGLSHYSDEASRKVIRQALKDDSYRVRLEAVGVVENQNITEFAKDLVYHCKTKEETVVKEKCYKVLAKLNTEDGNKYLVSVITDKKAGDSAKIKVAAALLEQNHAGTQEIINLALDTLKDDKRKSLRYALGKEFAKYGRPEFSEVCAQFIASKDPSTQGTGLDIFAKGRYESVRSAVQDLAAKAPDENAETKARSSNVNAVKAKKILEGLK